MKKKKKKKIENKHSISIICNLFADFFFFLSEPLV